jgi:DNA-binding XRE family transcriptional regulator
MTEKILDKIRRERIRIGSSQENFPATLNISQSCYNKIENGRTELAVNLLLAITSILDIDIRETLSSNLSQTGLKTDKKNGL